MMEVRELEEQKRESQKQTSRFLQQLNDMELERQKNKSERDDKGEKYKVST